MSHSRVFQLEKSPRKYNLIEGEKEWVDEYEDEKIGILNADEIEKYNFPDPNWVDYWDDSESSLEEDFDWLTRTLPEGVFEVDKDNLSLKLIKLPTDYVKDYFKWVKEESDKLNLDDFLVSKVSTWNLEKLMRNGSNEFMVYNDYEHYPIYIHEWLMGLAKNGEVGTTYYLGGVLDYHF